MDAIRELREFALVEVMEIGGVIVLHLRHAANQPQCLLIPRGEVLVDLRGILLVTATDIILETILGRVHASSPTWEEMIVGARPTLLVVRLGGHVIPVPLVVAKIRLGMW
jgi:hypothetical protein